jgi:hypothetical protein
MVAEDDVVSAIEMAERDPGRAAEALVAAANARGGEDNVTAVLFEIVEGTEDDEPLEPEVEAIAGAGSDLDVDQTPEATTQAPPEAGVQRHGAGKGGRLAALLLVAVALGVGLLVVYWGATQ